jgi:hypothetical protein
MIFEYWTSWDAELKTCQQAGLPVTDPLGNILEENDAGDKALDQRLTPPEAARVMNQSVREGDLHREWKTALDPWCGTGRIALDAVVHHPNALTFNIDLDLWMVRASIVNFHTAARYSSVVLDDAREPSASEGLFAQATMDRTRVHATDSRTSKSRRLIVIGGRTWVIRADSFIIDLAHHDNWRDAWKWNPPPWEHTMKVAGFDGTYAEWLKARPRREIEERLNRRPVQMPKVFDLDLDLQKAELHSHMLSRAKQLDLALADTGELGDRPESRPLFSGPHRVSTLDDGDFVLPQLVGKRPG